MKYLVSFHTTLKISRYLFRVLALMLWVLGALISVFYFSKVLNDKESALRQEYNLSFDQAQEYVRRSSETIRELRYVAVNHINVAPSRTGKTANSSVRTPVLSLYSLSPAADCQAIYQAKKNPLEAVSAFFTDWQDNFSTVYDLNRVFFVDANWQCMMDFGIRNQSLDRDNLLKNLQERFVDKKRVLPGEWRDETLYWITPASDADIGYLYAITPIYKGDKLETIMGIEQTIRLDDFVASGKFTTGAKLLDQYNQPLLQFTDKERAASSLATTYPSDRNYFGYVNGYDEIILKKALPPTTFNIVYFMPFSMLLSQLNSLIINLVLLNVLSAVVLFILAWVFERKMFLPAQTNAFQLEENEQFNRKIVASAPIGICILRIRDGTNLLSNELAHNYLGVLTHEDRIKITRIICEQQSKYVDVVTSRNHHLQISFVHSRYRNENVAICVLSDVSARVKMEESLQEVANAAEQASQSKSMFLATVSHELRTPLYGIIGNLDLLQTKTLSKDANRLVAAMQNSSALLLKIISDILDFSKIESEQLKIEPRVFTPREVISHITSNYLPLVVKKHLTLYCYIDPNVPASLSGDPVRLQQVLSNLVSNAIKFTDTGCIVFHVSRSDSYLEFWVRDTGVGIHPREAIKLFDPFFQAGSGVQGHFQGTGLGLAICEKLVNLMDGDMTLLSEPGLGSQFGLRIPLYQACDDVPLIVEALTKRTCWLVMRNANLEAYILNLLGLRGIQVHIHTGQPMAQEDMVISDHVLVTSLAISVSVLISGTHIGTAQEVHPGQWVMSTASPLDLPVLLQRIWCGEEQDTLPVAPSVAAYDPKENSDILILVVDDHPINRRLLADQLGSLGYQVITANDGVDALNTLSRKTADIVLTDVNMPNMDGYTLTRTLRDQSWHAPVIGVTANALAEERQRCLQAGMDNCLSKPVTLDVLQQSLAYYSQQVRAQRDNDNDNASAE